MENALKIGYLAFDATRIAATDVDFPIDVVLYKPNTYHIVQHNYKADELRPVGRWWQEQLIKSIERLPSEWVQVATNRLQH
jgi:putative proteasome-type protease